MILGAQLYTIRDYLQNESDIRYSLKKIANMGYKTVQVSAIGKIDPYILRDICQEYELQIVLTHSDINRILYDTENLIREHDILGCQYIGLGAMPLKYRSEFWIHKFIEDFKKPAAQIAEAGKMFMYHNHHFEFERVGDKRILEILMDGFSKEEMGITLDTYWVQAAGADVVEWIRYLQDRIPCVHLKDMAVKKGEVVMAPVLEGNMNFKKILDTLKDLQCTKYLLVEQDICQGSPFDCLKNSYSNLAALGYR